jgi:magnesium transporter
MARFFLSRKKSVGEMPGAHIFIGKQKMEKTRIRIMDYSPAELVEKEIETFEGIFEFIHKKKNVTWINIDGLHDIDIMNKLQETFNIHPLIIEDILNTDNRPKFDEDPEHITLILKILDYNKKTLKLSAEQFSLIIGNDYIITLQEQTGDYFDPVIDRIREDEGRIRQNGQDYLAYALLDSIIDKYIMIAGDIGEQIEELEKEIMKSNDRSVAEEMFRHKIEINYLRKCILPVKEMMTQLLKSESPLLSKKIRKFLIDLNELIVMTNEVIDTYQTVIVDQFNMYNSNMTHRTNETIKILTIFASVFIPLTFFAGVYGMNFRFLPELELRYGYLYFWIFILFVVIIILFFFQKKKWL